MKADEGKEELVDYIKNLSAQGYDAATIRQTLLGAGYSQFEVDESLRLAGVSHKQLSPLLFAAALGTIALVILLALVFLRTQAPTEAVLSINLNLFSAELAVGEQLIANADITNPSSTPTDGLIDFIVTGPAGRIASKTEQFNIETRTSVPVALDLPNAAPGTYTIRATANYNNKETKTEQQFTITETAIQTAPLPLEQKQETPLTCPGGCDDLNFCTTDSCVSGNCQYTVKTPCCGNRNCEEGETRADCPLDCSGSVVTSDQIRENAKQQAQSNFNSGIQTCETLGQQAYIDLCLTDVAEASSNKQACATIVDDDLRDACYIPFAYQNDFSVCNEIINPTMRNSCISLVQVQQTQQ